jgi:predicted nucleic acid-binding protein
MVAFFDTSVLVASSSAAHSHFVQASSVVVRAVSGKDQSFVSQHSIAGVYLALTRHSPLSEFILST